MTTVNNGIQFTAYVNGVIKACLNEIAVQVTDELMNTVWSDWYMSNNAQYYSATGQLLDSITSTEIVSSGSGFAVEIGFDTSKLTPRKIQNAFSEHMGFDDAPFTEGLVEVIEMGNPSPIYSHKGIKMLENTSKWLEKKLPSIAKRVFRKYGLNIAIT